MTLLAFLTRGFLKLTFGLALYPSIVGAQPTLPQPTAQVKNGTYAGTYNDAYKEDIFLGIPFAQPPVGDLRYRNPLPLNATWTGIKNATEYSRECWGFGSDDWVLGNPVSEDCLTLNVVRPAGIKSDAGLAVGVWIYGGGFFNGGSLDPRYNMSFIVQQSVAINKPMIGVSINYRLQGLGMLFSQEILEEGVANLGFKDQRLALHWIQENIAAFGGDPSKVTIWGESAGAGSVGLQLTAFGGRDDRLFRGAIQQSGGHVDTAPLRSAPDWQPFYDNITTAVNCSASADSLACLRTVPIETLAAVLNSSVTAGVRGWGASVDSDFLLAASNSLTLSGRFVRVPLLHGRNHDEGTMFATRGLNTTEQFLANIVSRGFSNATAQTLAILYPDIPAIGIPPTLNGRPIGPDGSLGVQWKRASAFTGDLSMHAPRRLLSQTYARYNVTSYSYHFNVLVNGIATTMGATHFQEVVFVFNNTEGLGYDTAVAKNPFENAPEALLQLAAIMSRMWVSFIVDGDPNTGSGIEQEWPVYTLENPQNMLFDINVHGLAQSEPDFYRAAEIQYLQHEIINTFR